MSQNRELLARSLHSRVSRRHFLKLAGLGGAAAIASNSFVPAACRAAEAQPPKQAKLPRLFGLDLRKSIKLDDIAGCSGVRGFNYQPTWGADGATIWGEKFDGGRLRYELHRGQELFPAFNTVRLWLSLAAFRNDPAAVKKRVAEAIKVCGELKLLAIPTLFMCWIGRPAFDPVRLADIDGTDYSRRFGPFIDAVVAPQAGNPFVLAWDLCNEPTEAPDQLIWYGEQKQDYHRVMKVQRGWLEFIRDRIKRLDPKAWTCVGTVAQKQDQPTREMFESLSDILTPHLYEVVWWMNDKPGKMQDYFEGEVRRFVEDLRRRKVNKAVLVSEAFWGGTEDLSRTDCIRSTKATFRRYGLGYLAYGLWESPVSDLHSAKLGVVGGPGNMCFINADGSLRAGHEVFNEE